MLIPVRFRIVAAFVFTAICSMNALAQAPAMTPEQVVEWAKSLPPGTVIDFEQVSTNEKASGQGAGMTGVGDGVNAKVDSSAPGAATSKTNATGGSTKATADAVQFQFSWLPILCWIAGVGCIAFGGYQFKLGNVKNATSFGIIGAAFIAIGFFPALLLVGLAGIAIYLLIQSGVLSKLADKAKSKEREATLGELAASGQAHENYEALRAVAAGVSDLKDTDPAAYAKLLPLISRHASEDDKAVIKQVRKNDDLN